MGSHEPQSSSTGTGKLLAYIAPATLQAAEAKAEMEEKVVISTATI